MAKLIDRTDIRYNNLVCKEYLGDSKWKCLCDCGKYTVVTTSHLTTGKTKSCGCLKYKYHIDENFFDEIDTEEKAYVLGIFAADGNVSKSTTNIKLELKYTDIEILEKIKKAMNYNFNIIHYNYKSYFSDNPDKIYENHVVRLNITNAHIHKEIQKYGIIPNKSRNLDVNLNLIPDELFRHFLRGLWDGDGSISLSHTGNRIFPSINLTTSSIMYDKIYDKLIQHIDNFKGYGHYRNKNKKYTKTLIITSQEMTIKILDYLYDDSTIYMDRKYQKYLEIKKHFTH